MKSKALFAMLAIIIFGGSILITFIFLKENHFLAFVLIQLIIVLEIILFVLLYRKLIRPFQLLNDGVKLLQEQDFSTRLKPVNDPETGNLIEIFNQMMEQLKTERIHIREKNHFLDLLITDSPQGVIIMDFDERIVEINPSGLSTIGVTDPSQILNKTMNESGNELLNLFSSLTVEGSGIVRKNGLTAYRCTRSSFIDAGFSRPFILFEEISDEILSFEKKSYENIIRMISHEINNYLATIQSTLEVIEETIRQTNDEQWNDILPVIEACFSRSGHLAGFVNALANIVRMPTPSKTIVNINDVVKSVVNVAQFEFQRRNISLDLLLSDKDILVFVDIIQIEQVLTNILKNAYEAIDRNGTITITTEISPPSVSIEDNGPGIPEDLKHKLFTPFFSTKPGGQGVGLMLVREVLINHNCSFGFRSKNNKTIFYIFFDNLLD